MKFTYLLFLYIKSTMIIITIVANEVMPTILPINTLSGTLEAPELPGRRKEGEMPILYREYHNYYTSPNLLARG